MKTHTKEFRESITPAEALKVLQDGNARFASSRKASRDLLQQVNDTSEGQYPFAAILSCIDSRTSAELIFDQGIGDLFSVRIAGNCLNEDILGSLEFSCRAAGAKLIVVLGHSRCGAVKGACDGVELGHLTGLLDKIKPAIDAVSEPEDASKRTSANEAFVDAVATRNVELVKEAILERSEVLAEMEKSGEIAIVGGYYDVTSGSVEFFST